jgi:peptidoglycan/xylan/chitin deacetylase (PgdA/CDA1 family)
MRTKAFFILLLTTALLLTGCTPPHANAQAESGRDIIVLESGHAAGHGQDVVTLKPAPTPAATPDPTLAPTPDPTPSPEPETPSPSPEDSGAPVNPLGDGGRDRGDGEKFVYLTFDDGPSKNTDGILEILAQKGVPATFFVIGDNAQRYPDKLRAIVAQGSLVANHSQTHKTDVIYQSEQAFLDDLNQGRQTILSILGPDYPDDLIRFPYGSTNRRCREYRDGVKAAGYRFFDWNALNGDAESGASKRSAQDLYDELVKTVNVQAEKGRDIIILMHDTNSKGNTVKMLPDAIDYLFGLGYTFATLENVPMS